MPAYEAKRPIFHKPTPGFSLLEVVGVLAVLAIVAAIVFAATTKSVDATVGRQESATLQSFAAGLQRSILRNHRIPGGSDWYIAIADEMGVSTNSVVFNSRNLTAPRAFMIDPNLVLGHSGGSLPYAQALDGSVAPSMDCRVMIVSSLGRPLPAAGIAPGNFSTVWNTSDGSLPSGFAGLNPDDLKIQRISLAPLFVKLSLANGPSESNGQYQVGTTNGPTNGTVPNPNGINAYFLQGTTVELIPETGGATNARLVLVHDASYFYVDQAWRDVPFSPAVPQTNFVYAGLAQKLSAAAASFSFSPANINGTATPQFVSGTISNLMLSYSIYAAAASTNGWASGPFYANAQAAQTGLTNALAGLINSPVQGQCNPLPPP